MLPLFLVLLGCASGTGAAPTSSLDPKFSEWWHDGKAELSGYSLTVDRYGARSVGTAVLIYVTEPFSKSKHVKVDDAAKNPSDVATVLKLNFVRKFQTGIYDYNTMGSTFAELPALNLMKSAFTSAEWCGHVYEQIDVSKGRLTYDYASYFEGESAKGAEAVPAGGMVEDELFVKLRGFDGPYLALGEEHKLPFLASAFYRRLAHHGLEWGEVTILRLPDAEVAIGEVAIPALRYEVRTTDGRDGLFAIEVAWPHRVLSWSWTTEAAGFAGGTDAGVLRATERLPYWELNRPGDESYLQKLGLGGAAAAR